MNDPFELRKAEQKKTQFKKPQLKKPSEMSDKEKKQAGAGAAAGAVVANEARGAYQNHKVGQKGRAISNYQTKVNVMNDVKARPRPKTSKVRQETHAPGIHRMTMDTVNQYRTKPTPNKNMDNLRSSIKADGFKAPIHMTVYRNGAKLWDGNHRAKVAAEQGVKSIPVSVTHSNKRKPIPTTLWAAKNELKHAKYRRTLTRVAKNEAGMSVSAFGVEHGYDISKNLPVKYVAQEGAKDGTRAAGTDKIKILGRMGPGKRSEFKRGFKGGANGQLALKSVKQQYKQALPGAKDAFAQARKNQANMSSRPKSFRAGTKTGRAAGLAAANPGKTYVGVAGGGTAAVVGNDIKNDRKKQAARKKK